MLFISWGDSWCKHDRRGTLSDVQISNNSTGCPDQIVDLFKIK